MREEELQRVLNFIALKSTLPPFVSPVRQSQYNVESYLTTNDPQGIECPLPSYSHFQILYIPLSPIALTSTLLWSYKGIL